MRRLLLSALFLAAAAPALFAASSDRVFQAAAILSGTFEGSTPGNHLNLNISGITIDPAHPFDLFLSVTGKFENTNVSQRGVIRLESQGKDVYFTYIPHFNPTVTVLSQDVGRFTERELTSACSFVIKPQGDGFTGDTLGTTSCAMAIQGATGTWSLEMEPGNLRVRNTQSGETLRFAQKGAKKP